MPDLALVIVVIIGFISCGILVRQSSRTSFLTPMIAIIIVTFIATSYFGFRTYISNEVTATSLLVGGLLVSAWFFFKLAEAHTESNFELEFIDSLSFLTTMLDNGVPLLHAIEVTAKHSKKHVQKELVATLEAVKAGRSIADATRDMAKRHNSSASRLFAELVTAAYTDGIDMQHLAKELLAVLTDRKRQRAKFYQAMSSIRYAALFAFCMPYVSLLIFLNFLPDWLDLLLSKSWGSEAVALAILAQVVGIIWLFSKTTRRLAI